MEIFNNHKRLFTTAFLLFALLTLFVAIIPALENQSKNRPLPDAVPLTAQEQRGKAIYISNGCVACHTQQVRNVDMDKAWGDRPGIAADYAGNERISAFVNTATLMGTERTGPDLTNIGKRQPGTDWHLLHLYQPRAVVSQSIMPAYPWLFSAKANPAKNDVLVQVPAAYAGDSRTRVVATQDALDLVAYLQSLKQVSLPEAARAPEFLYSQSKNAKGNDPDSKTMPEGKSIYAANCQSCHQPNGEGLPGAFPPLKGSPIVLNDNPETLIDIIMNGYDAREEFGVMPSIGTTNNLSAAEVSALINHERTSWGNKARPVSVEEVKKIIEYLKTQK